MLKLNQGVDILSHVGGVKNMDEAKALFDKSMDATNLERLSKIKNEEALLKIANAIALGEPDSVMIDTGSDADIQAIRELSLEKGEERKLAMDGHTIHFDLPQDQARLIAQTFYIVNPEDQMNDMAKSMPREEALAYVEKYMKGMMKGMTLMVGFYARGPVGAYATTPAIEMSTSGYVFHSAEMLYRNCYENFDAEVKRRGFFFTNVHSEGKNRVEDVPNARIFMDRSWMTTFSTFCTYAGNTLLMKKGNHRFSVDCATYFGAEKELSEHMFITGMTGPGGRVTYFAGAAPSGCGKTTTAMVGSHFVGDDLAQIWIADDGSCRAINPESGIFGIVADVNKEGDPILMKCLREPGTEVIWSNVLIDDKDVPHWEGNGEEHPDKGVNFQGDWHKGKKNADGKEIPISHKNARATLRASAIKNCNVEAMQDPAGVPVKIVTYSGRDADTMPPVWVGITPDEGVAIGASIVSAATATEIGATGVRRQPWANAPFIPGSLADYMKAQLDFFNSDKLNDQGRPILCGLNYFLTHDSRGGSGKGLLGEKRDVHVWLGWLELFANGDVEAIKTPVGHIPKYEDLKKLFDEKIGKAYPKDLYDMQFSLYIEKIADRIALQEEAYGKVANTPKVLFEVYDRQKKALAALRETKGAVVKPDDIG